MYLVTIEHDEDGDWWDDPYGFDSRAQAMEFIEKYDKKVPSDYSFCLYYCNELVRISAYEEPGFGGEDKPRPRSSPPINSPTERKGQAMTTAVFLLIDKSQSMLDTEEKYKGTLAGIEKYLNSLRETPDLVDVTLVTFMKKYGPPTMDKLSVRARIGDVPKLTGTWQTSYAAIDGNYLPDGSTPLIESQILAIEALAEDLKTRPSDKPPVFVTMTDGMENASDAYKGYTTERLNQLINQKKEEGWQFIDLGANFNQYAQSRGRGIMAAQSMSYDSNNPEASASAYNTVARETKLYTSGASASMSFKAADKRAAADKYYQKEEAADATAAKPKSQPKPKKAQSTPTADPTKKAADSTFSLSDEQKAKAEFSL